MAVRQLSRDCATWLDFEHVDALAIAQTLGNSWRKIPGDYATVRKKGVSPIGVIIETALMPPLAAAGYRVGAQEIDYAGGAFLLPLTNLVAIASGKWNSNELLISGNGEGRTNSAYGSDFACCVCWIATIARAGRA